MAHIDYYFSTTSPFTYLAGKKLEEIVAKHGATVTYKPFDIGSAFGRSGGIPLPERHPSRQEYRMQELHRLPRKLGLPLNPKPAHWPTNPAPSAYAIIAAQSTGGGDLGELVFSIHRACWAEDKDVADDAVIRECLAAAGFDPGLADKGLLSGAETYARNLEDAMAAGVFGSPFYVVDDGQRFWGQDRLVDLDLHLAGEI